MPVYTIQTGDGKTHDVEADDESGLDAFVADYEATRPDPATATQIKAPQTVVEPGSEQVQRPGEAELGQKAGEAVGKLVQQATPIGSLTTLKNAAMGPGNPGKLATGLAAADLAMIGLAPLRTVGLGARAGLAGMGQMLAQGAGAGGASWAAEQAGAPAAVQLAAGLAGGGVAGRMALPEATVSKLVPKGSEASALARLAQRFGLGVPEPASGRPKDVMSAFGGARQVAGKAVGAAKEALYDSKADPNAIAKAISEAGAGVLEKNIPKAAGVMDPLLAKHPGAAQSAMEQIDRLQRIDPSMTSKQAMGAANNVIESMKGTLAEASPKAAKNMSPYLAEPAKAMQGAFDKLAPPEALAAAKAADSAFSKIAKLDAMVESSSKTMAGATPGFNPRRFMFLWENMKPAEKVARFNPEEIKSMDYLVGQQDPSVLTRLAQGATKKLVVEPLNKLGLQGLAFHPTARFKEAVKPGIITEAKQVAPALGRGYQADENDRQRALRQNQALQAQLSSGRP